MRASQEQKEIKIIINAVEVLTITYISSKT